MKKVVQQAIFILVLIVISISAFAQAQIEETPQQKEPATKLETFLAKRGSLLIRSFYEIGKIIGRHNTEIIFTGMILYEPGQEEQKLLGIRVDITNLKSYGKDTDSSYLDMEELESLSQAISYMIDVSKKWDQIFKENTEVIFLTKGDFCAGFVQTGMDQMSFSSCGYGGMGSQFYSEIFDLGNIKILIDKGIIMLKEK